MTQPRARTADLQQQALAAARRAAADPDALPATRRTLLTLARQARERGDREVHTQVRQVMADVRAFAAHHLAVQAAASMRLKHNPTGSDPLTVWYARQLGELALLPGPAALRASALTTAVWPNATLRDLTAARRLIVQALWDARRTGDRATYAEVQQSYRRVCERMRREGRRLSPDDKRLRQRLRDMPPVQQLREAGQRVAADTSPARDLLRFQAQQRDQGRFRANVVAQALWAIHQGDRDWSRLDTKPHTGQAAAPGGVRTSGELPTPQRLEVRVPESQHGPAVTLHLYRADYERLLDDWGYHQAARAARLADKLRATADAADLAALYTLAVGQAGRPDLARAWHAYVSSARLGDVFAAHSTGSMQLAPRRNGDLREAALAVYALCKAVAFCTGSP